MRTLPLILALAGLTGCQHIATATDLACAVSRTGVIVGGAALELDVCDLVRPQPVRRAPVMEPSNPPTK